MSLWQHAETLAWQRRWPDIEPIRNWKLCTRTDRTYQLIVQIYQPKSVFRLNRSNLVLTVICSRGQCADHHQDRSMCFTMSMTKFGSNIRVLCKRLAVKQLLSITWISLLSKSNPGKESSVPMSCAQTCEHELLHMMFPACYCLATYRWVASTILSNLFIFEGDLWEEPQREITMLETR